MFLVLDICPDRAIPAIAMSTIVAMLDDIVKMHIAKSILHSPLLVNVPCHVPDAYRSDEYHGDGDCSDGQS